MSEEPLAAAAGLGMDDDADAEPELDMADAADDMEDAADDAADAADDLAAAADAAPEKDEEDLVMEDAKRVARRILKARKAKQMLDEALGND